MNKIIEWIDKTWGFISENVFVRFEFDIPVEEIKKHHEAGCLIFASTSGGFIEWLILSSWSRRQKLGAILVSNRRRILLFAKPLYFLQIILGAKKYSDLFLNQERGPRLFICPTRDRKRPNDVTPSERLLAEIYTKAGPSGIQKIRIVTVFIRWRKYVRGEHRKLSEYILGLSSSPNLIGKVWYLLRRRRDSTVRALQTLSLTSKESIDGDVNIDETEALRVAKSVRRKILVLTAQEMRVALGPVYHSPVEAKEALMRDPEIQKVIDLVAAERGVDRKKVMVDAYRNLTEIAANYRFRFVELMNVFLHYLFNHVFEGVVYSQEELLELRELMKNRPVIFVSSHRSHLDYLLIPYLLYQNEMVTPHIVAGVNLSFWPMGTLLRRGGAFFIRRSFRGDLLYSTCLKKYIEYLLKNRYNIKVFIEGTRSRTGKLLPPAYGILKMVLEAYENKAVEDIALVPTSLCYDQVFEEGSYTKELKGAEKEKESTKGFLKSRTLFGKRLGKVYIHFGKAISVKEIYKSAEEVGLDKTLMLQKSAIDLSKRINDVSPITPKSIVSSVFLGSPKANLSLEEILRLSLELARYTQFSGAQLSVPLDDGFKRNVEQLVRDLYRGGSLLLHQEVPRQYQCVQEKRHILNFYKNTAMHVFVLPAIAVTAVLKALEEKDAPEEGVQFVKRYLHWAIHLRGLLKFEFFFSPTHQFSNEMLHTLQFVLGEGDWSRCTKSEWASQFNSRFPTREDVLLYPRLIADLFESYKIVLNFFKGSTGSVFEMKPLLPKMIKFGFSELEDGKVLFPEAISTQNFNNAIQYFANREFLEVEGRKSVHVLEWNTMVEKDLIDLAALATIS